MRYYDPEYGTLGSKACWAGNISEIEGTASDNMDANFFLYDQLGRLKQTERLAGEKTKISGSYTDREITYDRNGNFKSFSRVGYGSNTHYLREFTYDGNKVMQMKNAPYGQTPAYPSFTWDANGNMTTDGLSSLKFEYNYLNLTARASDLSGNVQATYRWLSDGTKAGAKDAAGANGLEYLGSLVYARQNGTLTLKDAAFGGGRFVASTGTSGTTCAPVYHVTDYLGSTRLVLTAGGAILERNDYTQFGSKTSNSLVTDNRIRFTGYETQPLLGNAILDAGARFYNSFIFTTPDPMMEERRGITPYAYCSNNPVNRVDRNGMLDDEWDIDETGHVRNRIKTTTHDAFYIVDKQGKRLEGEQYSITFKYGTVTGSKQPGDLYMVGNALLTSDHTSFTVNGDENGSRLFEFMADKGTTTSVEWMNVKMGDEGTGTNYVSTKHSEDAVSLPGWISDDESIKDIRQINHNHPSGISIPSDNDKTNAGKYSKINSNLSYGIYTTSHGYTKFNQNGIIHPNVPIAPPHIKPIR